MSVMMAIVLLLYGIIAMTYYMMTLDIHGGHVLYGILMFIMPIISGILILMDKHHSVFWSVGLYAIAVGFSKVVYYIPGVFVDDLIPFVINLIFTIVACNLIYSGIRYLRGNARTIIIVLLTSTLLVVLTTISLALDFGELENLPEFIENNIDGLFSLVIYVMYIGLVWSEPVRKSTDTSVALRLSSGIRAVDGTVRRVSITDSDAQGILDFVNGKGSNTSKEELDGPVHSEYCFSYNDKFRTSYARLQRWGGPEGDIYMILADHGKGSIIVTNSLLIEGARRMDNLLIVECVDKGNAVFRIRRTMEIDGPLSFRKPEEEGDAE